MDLLPSSGPHLHILLNHIPSLGSVLTLALYLLAFYKKDERLKHACIMGFLVLALLAIPTYISGAAARWNIQARSDTDVLAGLIFAHQNAAVLAFTAISVTGCFAWLGLWQQRRFGWVPRWNQFSILGLGILTVILMIQTGSLGGRINHPEIRSGVEAVSAPGEPGPITMAESFITGKTWAWPAMEAAHFIGLALIFGTVLVLSLRILGVAKDQVSYAAIHRLLPLGVAGLIINVVTGMFFFIGDSGRYVATEGFPPKMMLLIIAGFAMIYFTSFDGPWKLKAKDDASIFSKAMAVVVLGSWAGVIVFGRLLPYFGVGSGG